MLTSKKILKCTMPRTGTDVAQICRAEPKTYTQDMYIVQLIGKILSAAEVVVVLAAKVVVVLAAEVVVVLVAEVVVVPAAEVVVVLAAEVVDQLVTKNK